MMLSAGQAPGQEEIMNAKTVYWGEKRYHSLDYHLKNKFGQKLYKLSLNGGMTCPNRDGSLGDRGCIFCSAGGSGDFAADPSLPVTEQIETAKKLTSHSSSYIAYFQAYTNTYAPCDVLRRIFTEAITHPDIRILSIATRPDCIDDEVLDLLDELNHIKPVWVELGLQTVHEHTAKFIRRGYELPTFEHAVASLRARNIDVITHVILGLPGEDVRHMLATVRYLNKADIQGIKLQLLHILEGTDLAVYYRQQHFHVLSLEEYIEIIGQCIANLNPDIVIHRLTGDGPKSLLVAPAWSGNKRNVLNRIQAYLKRNNIWQGKEYQHDNCI